MNLFDVYPLMPVTIKSGSGSKLWDENGAEYLDLYGGHAVISIGHSHPHFIHRIKEQLDQLAFYSNSVQIPIQKDLSKKLGELSGYGDYNLFLCNSGAEANENAIKMASFATGKSGIISFEKGFHGRTSAAVAATDNPKIMAPCNQREDFVILQWEDLEAVESELKKGNTAGIIIEAIQGVGGINIASDGFLIGLAELTKKYGAKLILDEVQAGFGRTGKFFSHQWIAGLKPDLISMAKGMGNGFPIGGVLISPEFEASYGLLGTTFGGNHLACAASLAVLEVLESEDLINKAEETGNWFMKELKEIDFLKETRGRGLMIGIDFHEEIGKLRSEILRKHHIFTGSSSKKETLRLLPALNIQRNDLNSFKAALVATFSQKTY